MNGLKIVLSIPAMFLSTPHNLTHTTAGYPRLIRAIIYMLGDIRTLFLSRQTEKIGR